MSNTASSVSFALAKCLQDGNWRVLRFKRRVIAMTIQAIRGRRRDQPTLDTLPENLHYNDTGCEASAYCLECPLPKCKYDDPSWYHQFKQESRDEAILNTYAKGATVFEVAEYFRVSSRTIHRALRRGRTSILGSAGLVSV